MYRLVYLHVDISYIHLCKKNTKIYNVPLQIYLIFTIRLLFHTTHFNFPTMDNHRSVLHQVTLVVVQLSPHSRDRIHSINGAIENQTKSIRTNTWFLDSCTVAYRKKSWFLKSSYIDLPVLPSTIGIVVYAKSCHVNQLWYNGMI